MVSREMEPPEEDFSEQAESPTPGGGSESWGGWRRAGAAALRQGWRVGKAAAVAGAAIAAAPVVVPPLLILSTLGAALSLPFGAYLASFACTDRLMRSLLPPTPSQPPPPVPQDDESESESDGGDPEEFLEAAEQDKKPLEDVQPPLENENEEEKEEVEELAEDKRVSSEEEKLLHAIENGAKAAEEAGLVEKEAAAAEFEETDAEITEMEAHGNGGSSTSVSVVSGVPDQRREDIGAARKVFEEMIASSKEAEAREERAMAVAVAEKEVVGTLEPSGLVVVESVEVLGESEPPGFSSGYASAAEDQSSVDMADAESRPSSVEHAGTFVAEGTVVASAVPSDGEVS